MNGGSWFFDENFSGVPDEFFDDVIKHLDFPLEDLEPNNLGVDDWNASLQGLEPPPMHVLSDFSSDFSNVTFEGPKNISISGNRAPQLKQRLSGADKSYGKSVFISNSSNSNDVKDSRLFQTSSPISVLESSSSCTAENSAPINPKLVFPVKRTRSKRRRPSTFNPPTAFPFISTPCVSEEYHPSTASDSGSETQYSEKSGKKKQKRKKNLTMLSGSKEIKKPYFEQSVANRKCTHCQVTETPQWREGPMGPKTLCNACGVRYRSGRLLPEYRPAASPTFVPTIHSNSHKRVLEMRNKGIMQ